MPIIADFMVVLDACVLANYAVTDVFLTFAEELRLYLPRWSEKILEETRRTHARLIGFIRLDAGPRDNHRIRKPVCLTSCDREVM
jgi:hypothetical protein